MEQQGGGRSNVDLGQAGGVAESGSSGSSGSRGIVAGVGNESGAEVWLWKVAVKGATSVWHRDGGGESRHGGGCLLKQNRNFAEAEDVVAVEATVEAAVASFA